MSGGAFTDRARRRATADWCDSICRNIESGRRLSEAVRLASASPPGSMRRVLSQLAEETPSRSWRDLLIDLSERAERESVGMAVAVLLTAEESDKSAAADKLRQLAGALKAPVGREARL